MKGKQRDKCLFQVSQRYSGRTKAISEIAWIFNPVDKKKKTTLKSLIHFQHLEYVYESIKPFMKPDSDYNFTRQKQNYAFIYSTKIY